MQTGCKAAHTCACGEWVGRGGGGVRVWWREINSLFRVERHRSKLDVLYRGVRFAAGQVTGFFFSDAITSAFWSHPFLYITDVSNWVIWRCKQDSGLAKHKQTCNPVHLPMVWTEIVCRTWIRGDVEVDTTRGLRTMISGPLILSNLKCSAALFCNHGIKFNHTDSWYVRF
jgi:hypothetical protein